MAAPTRAAQIVEARVAVAELRADVDRLVEQAGDEEDIVDEAGRLPQDRRELMLVIFSAHRSVRVRELRATVAEIASSTAAELDRTALTELRTKLNDATRQLDKLLAIPPLTANDMCSECPTPAHLHGWVMPASDGPCRAAARVRDVQIMLQRAAPTSEPERRPEAKLLAVIQSGLPIA